MCHSAERAWTRVHRSKGDLYTLEAPLNEREYHSQITWGASMGGHASVEKNTKNCKSFLSPIRVPRGVRLNVPMLAGVDSFLKCGRVYAQGVRKRPC